MATQDQIIRELIDAAYEGLNQLAIAAPYVRTHGNTERTGQSHTAWQCNESGKDIILAAIKKAEEAFPRLAA